MLKWGVLGQLKGQAGCGLSNGGVGGRVNQQLQVELAGANLVFFSGSLGGLTLAVRDEATWWGSMGKVCKYLKFNA